MSSEIVPHVEHIHIAEAKGAPVRALASAEAVAGAGLVGDRYARRQGLRREGDESQDLTLIEAEAVEALLESGIALAPGESRRNLTTRGVRLNDLVGKEFWIGEVLARGTELCEPCSDLVALTGKPLLRPLVHRGGLRADLLTSGRISVGDRIAVKDALPA